MSLVVADLIWALIGIYYLQHGDTTVPQRAFRNGLPEYAELMLFLVVAMTYINAMEEGRVFEALSSWMVSEIVTAGEATVADCGVAADPDYGVQLLSLAGLEALRVISKNFVLATRRHALGLSKSNRIPLHPVLLTPSPMIGKSVLFRNS